MRGASTAFTTFACLGVTQMFNQTRGFAAEVDGPGQSTCVNG